MEPTLKLGAVDSDQEKYSMLDRQPGGSQSPGAKKTSGISSLFTFGSGIAHREDGTGPGVQRWRPAQH